MSGDNDYPCQHGGPGELSRADKQVFVVVLSKNIDEANRQQVRLQYQQILATELVIVEELCKNEKLKKAIDMELVRLYFSMAADALIKARVEPSRTYARIGVYLAMFLRHGDDFWTLTKQEPEIQQVSLKDMYTALGKLTLDKGLVEVVNAQTPCTCVTDAFAAARKK